MRFSLCLVWLCLALAACSKREATLPIGEKVCHCGTDDALPAIFIFVAARKHP